jgi:glucokinase
VIATKSGGNLSLGVDVGGTKISIGIVTDTGTILDKLEIKTGPDYAYTAVGAKLVDSGRELLDRNDIAPEALSSIGIGIPGTTDSETGVVEFAPNLGWTEVPFGEFVRGKLDVPLFMVQETHAAVLAEYLFGAGRGTENLACVAIGTGIGCGLILGGRLHRGSFNTAGEFGHILVQKNGNTCACGRKGCLEAYGSGPSITRRIAFGEFEDLRDAGTERIFAAAIEGREDLREAIVEAVEYVGMGLVNVVNLLSPEKILLTGGLAEQEMLVVDTLRRFVRNNAYSVAAEKVAVEKAALGKDAPMIGAAMLSGFVEPVSAGTYDTADT